MFRTGLLGLALLAVAACASTPPASERPILHLDSAPELHMQVEEAPESWDFIITGSGGIQPGYRVIHDGITFDVAVDKVRHVITYVSTSDPAFRTADGVGVGTPVSDLRVDLERDLVEERGWGSYVRLKSGWEAFVSEIQFEPGKGLEFLPVTGESRVIMFFKKCN
mgnify:FL=1